MTEKPIVLEAKGITKQFPGVLANDHVDFDLRQGEVHALLGENGAGKTTLMNILYGLYNPDSGEVLVNGQPIDIQSPKDSIKAGIGMVHQHFMLIPVFNVAENVVLGYETEDFEEVKQAGFWRRAFAFGIDLLITVMIGMLVGGVLGWLIRLLVQVISKDPDLGKSIAGLVTGAGILAVGWLYHAWYESSRHQATLGKWMLGLLVTGPEFQRLSFKLASARFWLKGAYFSAASILFLLFVIFLTPWIRSWILDWVVGLVMLSPFIPFFMAGFTSKGQTLYDMHVHSLVIDKEKEWGVLHEEDAARKVREISEKYGLEVEPEAITGQLPVGLQQRVEIVKTLYRNAKILILDEPTAVLTPQEVDELFKIVRELTRRGVSIIFITHKLKEVLAVADRITTMRGGKVVGTVVPQDTNEAKLAAMMVGREVILKVEKEPAQPGDVVLDVNGLRVKDARGLETVRGVSFDVRGGEVLGIAGVQGNGQTELVEALTGLRLAEDGKATMHGKRALVWPNLEFGGFWRRGMAWWIDALIYSTGLLIIYLIANSFISSNANATVLFAILGLVSIVGTWLYFALQEASALQATLGKRVMNLMVTDKNGGRLSFWRATARFFAKSISTLPLMAGYFMAAFMSRKQALHDIIAGTLVYHKADATPRIITETGMAHVPEDRQRHGLVLNLPVADNMVLNTYYRKPFGKWGVMIQSAIDANARKLIEDFDVRTPSPYVPVKKLSGGNQQKVIVARELSHDVRLLIANQPTRGLDVGSIEYIHKEIIIMRDRGVGVLLVSAELDEIMALSDRIAVMYRGEIVATVKASDATREKLGLWMAGAHPED